MILVDTTVWIDFFLNHDTQQVSYLTSSIEKREDICLCGIILTEILQGIKNPKEYRQVSNLLDSLIFLEMNQNTFILAADIFRDLRRRGVTIRKTMDCMIAAVAIEYNVPLIHNDRDFDFIEKYCRLRTIK